MSENWNIIGLVSGRNADVREGGRKAGIETASKALHLEFGLVVGGIMRG